jgi:hypothetical protein
MNMPFSETNMCVKLSLEYLIWIETNGKYIRQPLDSKSLYIINVKDYKFGFPKEYYDFRKEHD